MSDDILIPDDTTPDPDDLHAELAAAHAALAAAEATAAAERQARLQLTIALQHGLPAELADRLQGDDAAALNQDAARLAALLPARRDSRVGHSTQQSASRAHQIFNRIGGGTQNAFDVLLQRRSGGGAIIDADE